VCPPRPTAGSSNDLAAISSINLKGLRENCFYDIVNKVTYNSIETGQDE